MRLVSFVPRGQRDALAGWLAEPWVVDSGQSMEALLTMDPAQRERLRRILHPDLGGAVYALTEVRLLAPLPRPRSIRDFYAFEAHVRNARARRGLPVPPQWYEAPVFYFSNSSAVLGPDDWVDRPPTTGMLDFELEVAAVIGREGRDIPRAEADRYIAGYMIMNDWSARDLQQAEMQVGLGPAKGKDFATSLGPWILTADELADRADGEQLHLTMRARVGGEEVSRGTLADLHFSFAQMIERASSCCTLYPGEVIGSGTVGTGCLLETGARGWLQPGDRVELEVERLGILSNTVR